MNLRKHTKNGCIAIDFTNTELEFVEVVAESTTNKTGSQTFLKPTMHLRKVQFVTNPNPDV